VCREFRAQPDGLAEGLARRAYLMPWRAEPPIGLAALTELTSQVS
jgi:hypothetical protein